MELSFPIPKQKEILGPFATKWFEFVSRFRYRQKQKGERKYSFMLHFGAGIVEEMQESHNLSWEDFRKFSTFVESLEHECLFQIVLSFLRFLFFNHKCKAGTGIKDFYKELELLSEWCSFEDAAVDSFIKDQIIQNVSEENVKNVFLSGINLKAKDVVDICSKIEGHGDPVSQELVLTFLKEQQHSPQFAPVEVENHSASAFQESQTLINETSNFSTVLFPDHQYTNNKTNIGDSVAVNDLRPEYETYSVEIFEPVYTLSDLTSNIANKTSMAEKAEGVSSLVLPSPQTTHTLTTHTHSTSYPTESSLLSIFSSAPLPLSDRPCLSVHQKKKSKRGLTLASKEPSTDCKASKTHTATTYQACTSTNTTTASKNSSLQKINPNLPASVIDGTSTNSFETIFISISNPNVIAQSVNDYSTKTPLPNTTNSITITVAEDVNEILEPNFCAEQEVELKTSQTYSPSTPLPVDPFAIHCGEDVSEIPQWCCSKQKAFLKTSQIKESTGQNLDVYSCNFCAYSCTGKDDIEVHVIQQHKSLKCFVCTICNQKFSHEEQFGSHVRTQHLKMEEHRCQTCDMVFDSQDKLFLHIEDHAEAVSCRVCHTSFPTEKLLSDHMASMHPELNRWSCYICTSTFLTRKSLSDHLCKVHKDRDRTKEQDKPRCFMCKQCGMNFSDKRSSEMHRKKFHWKPRAKQFQCDICPYTCGTKHKLTTHHRIHTGEKPYICEICGKGFAQLSALTRHTRYHTGEKPYKCQYCERTYFTSTGRLAHERKHRNERPYVCEQCSKTFRNSSELKMHIETHNEFRIKRFQCHCGAAFDTRRNLKRHAVRHSGVKAHKCEICGASFTHPENVRGHQKSGACRNRMLKLMKLKG